ncbi:Phospholipid methyltransferase [Penicillium cosmopolitanum]|uniref:Phospholipid methyltransferase n=1 Tax=Penicillium cosmopolitanum TaxID=1131564 RepID=A0A9W9VQT6_9EURO|nr:Phospholipid methyltransferase [Penicillium cosmopolitanum]KAJ5387510.1 Phospholipid methyltransferase [Penicillium cosmopolitanum]
MIHPGSIVLATAMVLAGYLATICFTPPNASPDRKERHKIDRTSSMGDFVPLILRQIVIVAVAYHAALAILSELDTPSLTAQACPRPNNPNPALFSWTSTSVTALLLVLVGAWVRLSAFGGLGPNFTFHLARPSRLVTTGIYRWVQHPSYTGHLAVIAGCTLLFMRWDGASACWIEESILVGLDGWGLALWASFMGFSVLMIRARVKDEEDMLKQLFGKEWEDWNRSTKRFIPGLF